MRGSSFLPSFPFRRRQGGITHGTPKRKSTNTTRARSFLPFFFVVFPLSPSPPFSTTLAPSSTPSRAGQRTNERSIPRSVLPPSSDSNTCSSSSAPLLLLPLGSWSLLPVCPPFLAGAPRHTTNNGLVEGQGISKSRGCRTCPRALGDPSPLSVSFPPSSLTLFFLSFLQSFLLQVHHSTSKVLLLLFCSLFRQCNALFVLGNKNTVTTGKQQQ